MWAVDAFDVSVVLVLALIALSAVVIVIAALARGGGEVGGWEVRGAWPRVRAVARVTLAEAVRMKIVVVFLVLLAGTLPLLCLTARGDGTIRGQVQMFIGYAIGLTGFYLALLTIFFSSRTLAAEIASRQIFGLVSKPVPRWQILAGKWLGIMTLNALMVAMALGVTYGGVRWLVGRFERELAAELVHRGGLTRDQAEGGINAIRRPVSPAREAATNPVIAALAGSLGWSDDQTVELLLRLPEPTRMNLRRLNELRRQVLVARASIQPDAPDLRNEVEERFELLRQQGRLPTSPHWTPDKVREEIRLSLLNEHLSLPPMRARQWVLKGPPPVSGEDRLVSVRYKLDASIYTGEAALIDGSVLPENTLATRWIIGDPAKGGTFGVVRIEINRAFHEIDVPPHCVEPDGTVFVRLENIDPRRVDIVVPLGEGLEVLYRVASFERNLARAAPALLVPLALLASFGLLMSTFCTYPVAAMVTLSLFAVANSRAFLSEALYIAPYQASPTTLIGRDALRAKLTTTLFDVLSTGKLDPANKTLDGRAIGWAELGREAGTVAGLRGGASLFLAVLILRRRELAAEIV